MHVHLSTAVLYTHSTRSLLSTLETRLKVLPATSNLLRRPQRLNWRNPNLGNWRGLRLWRSQWLPESLQDQRLKHHRSRSVQRILGMQPTNQKSQDARNSKAKRRWFSCCTAYTRFYVKLWNLLLLLHVSYQHETSCLKATTLWCRLSQVYYHRCTELKQRLLTPNNTTYATYIY